MRLNYIVRNMGENEFQKMCDILSIKPQLVKDNDLSAGGAQYILKNCNTSFWSKIESDCELLFSYLYTRQKHQKKIHPKFQIWCTDMWVIWWNALLIGQPFKIHPLLDFCWVDSPVENLSSTIILHYTGSSKKDVQIFDKTKYRLYSPFYDDLSNISPDLSSIFVVQTIKSYQHCLNSNRITLKDTAIIILFDNIGNQSQAKAEIAFRYFSRYLDTEISIHHKQEEEQIWQNKKQKHCWFIPAGFIFSINSIQSIICCLEQNQQANMKYKFKTRKIDPLGCRIFSYILDCNYLE